MAVFRCPKCDNPLTSEERASGVCPACGAAFQGSVAERAADPVTYRATSRPEEHVAPRTVSRQEWFRWATVRAGLGLIVAGAIIGSIMIAAGLCFVTMGSRADLSIELVAFSLVSLGMMVATIGSCMACAAPGESGARGLAIGNATCVGMFAFAAIWGMVFPPLPSSASMDLSVPGSFAPESAPQRQSSLPNVMAGCSIFLAPILFLLFMRRVATYFHSHSLAYGILVFLWVFVLSAILSLVALGGSGTSTAMPILVGCVLIGLLVWSLALVIGVRRAISQALSSD